MLSLGNTKLGFLIHTWSLPAWTTCPGRTAVCKELCYAMRGRYHFKQLKHALLRRFAKSLEDDFPAKMIAEIRKRETRVLRIHAAGDFYDLTYIDKWRQIVDACPKVTFYAYTRSWWRDGKVRSTTLARLIELGERPNFHLWLSEDINTGPAPKIDGIRRCFLTKLEGEQPPWKTDLVFRNLHKSVMKFATNESFVCPYENGVTRNLTCSSCKVCWTGRPLPKKPRRHRMAIPLVH